MRNPAILFITIFFSFFLFVYPSCSQAQVNSSETELDKKVKKFLDSHPRMWEDMNVPAVDGQLLFDLIIKGNYKKGLEIGTSTGHSTIWIAWAMSKTGGKVITIEIDEGRRKQAQENFKKAGLEKYIDSRLANAHELVPKLKGPFDFVFSDADKGWYKNYFLAVDPSLEVNGCFTSHNVRKGSWGWAGEYLKFLESLPNYKTNINDDGSGIAISYKVAL